MISLLRIALKNETDIVNCRQRVRQIAGALGLDTLQQTQVATAVSEAARNAVRHGLGGKAVFLLENTDPYQLIVEIEDQGPGIPDLDSVLSSNHGMGLKACFRLTDSCSIQPGVKGTKVTLVKHLARQMPFSTVEIHKLVDELVRWRPNSTADEIKVQNEELIVSFEELRKQQEISLHYQVRLENLNKELADTNRGVIALNSELEDQAKTIREASEVKARFLSHVTHEFRTPVNSILSMSRILLSDKDKLDVEQQKQLGFIRQAAEGLSDMVNDLLDTVKLEARKLSVNTSVCSLTEIFDALKALFRPLLPADGAIELVFEDVDMFSPFLSDETKIAQILRNPISNAIKFTEHGQIRVYAESVGSDRIKICVTDTGIGVKTDDQDKIFEEFYQVHGSLQKKAKGTGLGLPLARKLARLLQGEVTLASKAGSGSTFSVEIPYIVDQARVTNVEPRKILIIDDDEASQLSIAHLFKAFPFEFGFALNGMDGLKLASSYLPDLIFLDVRMPGMDGFEVLKHLKESEETSRTPVVLNSSMNFTWDDFLDSPHKPDYILLKDHLQQGQNIAPILHLLNLGGQE